mgnify:CR=1 FL=1
MLHLVDADYFLGSRSRVACADVLEYVVCADKDKLVACYMHHVKQLLKVGCSERASVIG